jgi:hypothetical protein
MRELDFTLEDVGDPLLFTAMVTRERLKGLHRAIHLLLLLLGRLESAWASADSGALSVAPVKRALGGAHTNLLEAGDDIERALRRRVLPHWYCGITPFELDALEEGGDPISRKLTASRERMAGVHAELDMLLVLLIVLDRTCQDVGHWQLARAKRAVRKARKQLAWARAALERAFPRGPVREGGVSFGRRTS